MDLRPFDSVDDLKEKLGQQGKKKGGTSRGVSSRMFDDCVEIFRGYGAVDDVLAQCERIGGQLNAAVASWSQDTRKGKDKATIDGVDGNGALSLIAPVNERTAKDFLNEQPKSLSKHVQLKGYQLLGVNWLRLLYKKGRSCILADEMGTLIALRSSYPCLRNSRLGKDRPGHQLLRSLEGKRQKGPTFSCCPVRFEISRNRVRCFTRRLISYVDPQRWRTGFESLRILLHLLPSRPITVARMIGLSYDRPYSKP